MSKQQNDFTTREQSKRLLELGVPADSANLFYSKFECETFENRPTLCYGRKYSDIVPSGYEKNYLPCWSVGRLMEIFAICFDPDFIHFDTYADGINFLQQMMDKFETYAENMDFSKLEEV